MEELHIPNEFGYISAYNNKRPDLNKIIQRNDDRLKRFKRSDDNRQYVWDYLKEHPCVKCGENDPVVLEFNHIDPSMKEGLVSDFIYKSRTKLINEIEKCEVMCANCHRRHHFNEGNYYSRVIK